MDRRTLAIALTLTLMPGASFAQRDREALVAALEGAHPAAYYARAGELFSAGRRDEAVFVFYLGQLRFRTHIAARRGELRPDGDPALFASLSEGVGRPINEYAFGDVPALARTLDDVLAYDASNPDRFTPPARAGAAGRGVRDGLVRLRRQIVAGRETIRAERARNGLPNRN